MFCLSNLLWPCFIPDLIPKYQRQDLCTTRCFSAWFLVSSSSLTAQVDVQTNILRQIQDKWSCVTYTFIPENAIEIKYYVEYKLKQERQKKVYTWYLSFKKNCHKVIWIHLLSFSVSLAFTPFSSTTITTVVHKLVSCSKTHAKAIF